MQQWKRKQNRIYMAFIIPAAAFFITFFIFPFFTLSKVSLFR